MADVFVDFTAANDGDGTAHTQAASPGAAGAYNQLAGKTFSAGDLVWIRRKELVVTASQTFNQADVKYIGWPISGDVHYDTRPAAAQASWDPDPDNHAKISCTTGVTTYLVLVQTSTGQEFHGLRIEMGFTNSSNSIDAVRQTVDAKWFRCYIESQHDVAIGGTSQCMNYQASAEQSTFSACTFLYSGLSTGASFSQGCAFYQTLGTVELVNCILRQTDTGWDPTNAKAGLLVVSGGASAFVIGATMTSSSTAYKGRTSGNALINVQDAGSALFLYASTLDTNSTAQSSSLLAGADTVLQTSRLVLDDVSHMEVAADGAIVHLAKFAQSVAVTSGYAIELTGKGITFSANNVTFASFNASGDVDLGGTNQNLAFFQNVTFTAVTPFGASPGDHAGAWCADHGGTVGLWKFIGPNGEITSNSVFRSGGESFSLKFEMLSGVPGDPLWKGLRHVLPAFETVWVSLPAAETTLTLYGAHKLYGSDAPNASDIWFEVDYLDSGSGASRSYASTFDGEEVPAALTSDASIWSGDTGLTAFSMSVTITPAQACLVPVRVYFRKRKASAYWYLDPQPVTS